MPAGAPKGRRDTTHQSNPPRRLPGAEPGQENQAIIDAVEDYIHSAEWMNDAEFAPMRELLRSCAGTVAKYPDLSSAQATLRSVLKDCRGMKPPAPKEESKVEALLRAI